MSHQPERKEKDCLNCSTLVEGRFCQNCGQENIVPHQNFFSLTKHFIYDIFHFDGKFFDTLRYLVTRPGFVPREYVLGKRMSYLDPIRMYLFTSAVFFLVFFTVKPIELERSDSPFGKHTLTPKERYDLATILNKKAGTDSAAARQLSFVLDDHYRIELDDSITRPSDTSFQTIYKGRKQMLIADRLEKRDSLGNIRSSSSWLERVASERWKVYREKYGDDSKGFSRDLIDKVLHKFPYILFISLPFFAGILKLLYIRRKRFLYSDHAVFTLYQYIFTFILLLFYFLFKWLGDYSGVGIFNVLGDLIFLSGGVYLFLGMKRFYEQRIVRTFFKFLALNFLAILVMILLMVFFFVISVFQI